MNKDKLKVLITQLKALVSEIESEVYSDTSSYTSSPTLNIDYGEVLKYYDVNDDDGDYE